MCPRTRFSCRAWYVVLAALLFGQFGPLCLGDEAKPYCEHEALKHQVQRVGSFMRRQRRTACGLSVSTVIPTQPAVLAETKGALAATASMGCALER